MDFLVVQRSLVVIRQEISIKPDFPDRGRRTLHYVGTGIVSCTGMFHTLIARSFSHAHGSDAALIETCNDAPARHTRVP